MQSVQLNRCFRRPFSVELWIPLNIYSPIFNEWVMLIQTIQLNSCLHKMESTVNIPRKNSIFNRLIDNSVNQNAIHFVINQCLRLLVPSNVRCSTAFGRSISGHSQFLCSPRLHAFCTVFIYKQNGCWTLPSVKKFANFCPGVQYCSCAAQYFFFINVSVQSNSIVNSNWLVQWIGRVLPFGGCTQAKRNICQIQARKQPEHYGYFFDVMYYAITLNLTTVVFEAIKQPLFSVDDDIMTFAHFIVFRLLFFFSRGDEWRSHIFQMVSNIPNTRPKIMR